MHRVQRVPVTESQGRIHTSAAGVLVMPEAEEVEVTIDENDLRIDVFRSSGPGGQSVNTTDSAVRITHLPTGIVVSCQNEKSQLQNKEQAMRILRARLLPLAQEAADAGGVGGPPQSQVRTVDRSERIRTYNYPENRISDHRTGYKAYNLDQVLDGDLDPLVQSCRRRRRGGPPGGGGPGLLRLVTRTLREAVRARLAGPRGGRRRAAPTSTPWRWPRTSCAPRPARCTSSMVLGAEAPAGRRSWRPWWPSGPGGCRCSTSPDGRAFRHLELSVGPGVFVPRPETELLADLAVPLLLDLADRERRAPVVVDLCTGSGAIALSLKHEVPAASVHAVELSDLAHAWAVRNRDDLGLDVELVLGDATDRLRRARGRRSTSSSATRRTSRSVRCRSPPRCATTTRTSRSSAAAPTACGSRWRWPPGPPGCSVPAGCC